MKPKPSLGQRSKPSACLSKPAANPTGFGKSRPNNLRRRRGKVHEEGGERKGRPSLSATRATRCAASGGKENRMGRATEYKFKVQCSRLKTSSRFKVQSFQFNPCC